ncbi:MAG: ABC transporter permease [Gammaproteobacteria bacterium]|nr:ABC transporter permease [Gammaproteobacteria bacterium]
MDKRTPGTYLFSFILISWFLLVLLTPLLSFTPNNVHLEKILLTPSFHHGLEGLLGYDDLGRSVLERLLSGAKISFLVAFGVAFIALCIGTIIGLISAYIGGVWDHIIVRLIDIFMAFPGILLAIALSGLMGPGIDNVMIALCVVGWVGYARLTRAQVLSIKQREHVSSARALGASHIQIISKHILPLIISPLIIEFTFAIAGLVIAEAGLSFLGLGIQAPESSWGNMIKEGSQYLLISPHLVIMPGLCLLLVVLSVNQIGDALRDYLDPKTLVYSRRVGRKNTGRKR